MRPPRAGILRADSRPRRLSWTRPVPLMGVRGVWAVVREMESPGP